LQWRLNRTFFMGWNCQPHVPPPTWRTRVSLFVWVITCDLVWHRRPYQ
jgi:hypothetical protein